MTAPTGQAGLSAGFFLGIRSVVAFALLRLIGMNDTDEEI